MTDANPLPTPVRNRATDLSEKGGLPERNAEVIALVEAGHSYREIEDLIGIDKSTIADHVSNYRDRLDGSEWLVDNGYRPGDVIETRATHHSELVSADRVDPDYWGVAIRGDLSVHWAIESVDDDLVAVESHYRHGPWEHDESYYGELEADADEPIAQIARRVAEDDPVDAIDSARSYWEQACREAAGGRV